MKFWYYKNIISYCLWPLSWVFRLIARCRRFWLEKHRKALPLPVIIVGNINVGGTGKTPFVIWLCQYLQQRGCKVGIVSRGYRATTANFPKLVTRQDPADQVGDEAKLIADATSCPVVIDPNRCQAVEYLAKQTDCNIVISDDGLQHYAMSRILEIIIVDGTRPFGNRWCLPAGPLREPLCRLREVDLIISNGTAMAKNGCAFQTKPQALQPVDGSKHSLTFKRLHHQSIHAVAGIGNPQRFFDQLTQLGVNVKPHIFRDHHTFTPRDFNFDDGTPIIMTAKDAIKCQSFAQPNWWYLPITIEPNQACLQALEKELEQIKL